MPRIVDVSCPGAQFSLRIDLGNVAINRLPVDGSQLFTLPTYDGYPLVDLGKPNPLMIRSALNDLDVHSGNSIMVGDRMDTDVLSGISSGMDTVLVLSGTTDRSGMEKFSYRPKWVFESVADINPKELD